MYDGTTGNISLYMDGELKGSEKVTSFPGTFYSSISHPICIGAYGAVSCTDYEYGGGKLDEIRIYNRALSAEEIQQLYMSNLYKYDTDKWAFYINQTKNATDVLDEGTYTYQAFAKDEADNWNSTEERNITIEEGLDTLQIIHVYNETMDNGDIHYGPKEGPNPTYMTINFTVYNENGFENLNHSSAKINVSKSGEVPRVNSSCYNTANYSTYYANYSCRITMWWWDGSGIWTINATISDNSANITENSSMTFFVGETDAFVMSPTVLTWDDLTAGETNQEANENVLMNNTGNVAKYIEVNATNLYGETDSNLALWAGNFTVKNAAGCEGTAMVVNAFTNVTSTALPVGNFTLNDGSTGQEEVYVCLEQAGSELIAQSYSTGDADWSFKIVTQ
jgi:hypothetical protein